MTSKLDLSDIRYLVRVRLSPRASQSHSTDFGTRRGNREGDGETKGREGWCMA